MILVALVSICSFVFFIKYKNQDLYTIPNGYGIYYLVLLSVIIFILLFYYSSAMENRKIITKISGCTLIAYSVSYIGDEFCKMKVVPILEQPLEIFWFIICVFINFTFSVLVGLVGTRCISFLQRIKRKI